MTYLSAKIEEQSQKLNIAVVGAGYVGLVSAACFAEAGWKVECIDKDQERVEGLQAAKVPIYEPGLDVLIERNVAAERLTFSMDVESGIGNADVVLLAVGTPMRRGDGHAELSHVFSAIEDIAPYLCGFTVIVTKSTVPVGTSRKIEDLLTQIRPDVDIAVCSNPEFLREGSAINDFLCPDRILIGCDDRRAEGVLRCLYTPITVKKGQLIVCSRESSELAKYAANAFLAMKLSFINEMADLCECVGADVEEVALAMGRDSRIGEKFLQPGPGYGGSCFPKDVAAIIRTARDYSSPLSLVEAVQRFNEERKIAMAKRIREALGGQVRGKTIGVLGVTFKPDTDDVREAPSLAILPILVGEGAKLQVYDPEGKKNGIDLLPPNVEWCNKALDVANGSDALVILTEWCEFNSLDLKMLSKRMNGRELLDMRNVFTPSAAAAAGLNYIGIGRQNVVDHDVSVGKCAA